MEIKIKSLWKIIYYLLGIDFKNKEELFERLVTLDSRPIQTRLENFSIFHIFSYEDKVVRDSIHRMKYNNDKDFLRFFAKELSKHLKHYPNAILIPVPSTRRRIRERGLWTVGEICRMVNVDVSYREDLIARKDSKKQSHSKDRETRSQLIKGSFYIKDRSKAKYIKDKYIICIDDVFTTGATLKDIYRVCKESNCSGFEAWTIAH